MTTDTDPRKVAEGLSEKQKAALLAMPLPFDLETVMQGTVSLDTWMPASELSVHPATLTALNCVGGVDPKTLLPGPCLIHAEWGEGGKRWYAISSIGLAVRAILETDNG